MKTVLKKIAFGALGLLLASTTLVLANPDPDKIIDQYAGDTSIYTLRASEVPVNVLFLIDNSYSAKNIASGEVYNPTKDYFPATYSNSAVYVADNQGDFSTEVLSDYSLLECDTVLDDGTDVGIDIVQGRLEEFGTYSASGTLEAPIIDNKDSCGTAPKGETYALGRYLNYLNATPPDPPRVRVGDSYYSCKKTHVSTPFNSPLTTFGLADYWTPISTPSDAADILDWRMWALYPLTGMPQIELIHNAINLVAGGYREQVHFGAMQFNNNNKGGEIVYPISDLSDDADFRAFMDALPYDKDNDLIPSTTARPQLGTMMDALAYYQGADRFPMASADNPYDSPITIRCQPNFIILITNGMSNESSMNADDLRPMEAMRLYDADGNEIGAPCGDVDQDGDEMDGTTCDASYGRSGYSYLDDMALWMRNTDLIDDSVLEDDQTIMTGTVLAFQTSEPLVQSTGEQGGLGFAQASNANQLADRLAGMLENIVRRSQSTFVAPVVPASPENRVRSGQRIYLGFFKPQIQEMWHGNLKKYILSSSGEILGVDSTGAEVPYDTVDSYSLWEGAESDVGVVEKGGVGEKVKDRAAADSRKIYTFLNSDYRLTAASNQLHVDNKIALASKIGGTTAEVEKTINFVRGRTTLSDGRTVPREWVLGDILHSKPQVFNYRQYDFNLANEEQGPPGDDWTHACDSGLAAGATDCNKTMIYVGANDGLLHAFSDYNGEELWAFAPPDLLPYLKELSEPSHSYFVDGSVSIYSYDRNQNGEYTDPGDYVILVFGTRRGGGMHQLDPLDDPEERRGTYYALDVTVPNNPKFLFALSSDRLTRYNGSGLETITTASVLPKELGETWSQPFIRPVVVDGVYTIALFFGAGYDNNEDMRWGSTQSFPLDVGHMGTSEILVIDGATNEYNLATSNDPENPYYADFGCGSGVSGAVCGQVNPRGRGLYVYELAREGTSPSLRSFAHTGEKIWAYTNGEHHSAATNHIIDNTMTFSLPADIKVVDVDNDGMYDRVYAADTGGRVWRFLIGDANDDGTNVPSEWSGKIIFEANPGSDSTNGRKFFYSPDYNVIDSNRVNLFISSGDRAHPLNHKDHGLANGAVLDRIYMIKDYIDDQSALPPTVLDESYLLDVTVNELDDPATSATRVAELQAKLTNDPWTTTDGTAGMYGWYIKLSTNPGEKALSPPLELLGYLMQTTYSPNTNIEDPCEAGNQGVARFYALSAVSGRSALDLNGDNTIDADDRATDVGGGIPPEVTPIVTNEGVKVIMVVESTGDDTAILDGTVTEEAEDAGIEPVTFGVTEIGTIYPVYWMQW